MVASGLPVPTKNRTRHATEVASMSLEIMSTVSEATVPHIPQERWKVRIGINSGTTLYLIVKKEMILMTQVDETLVHVNPLLEYHCL